MTTSLTIDKAGRVVIPKKLRDAMKLNPGDNLKLESVGEEITLRPIHETAPLQKEHGFWVFRTGRPPQNLSITEWVEQDRKQRDHDLT